MLTTNTCDQRKLTKRGGKSSGDKNVHQKVSAAIYRTSVLVETTISVVYTPWIKLWEAICVFQKLKSKTALFIIGLSVVSYVFCILSSYFLSIATEIDISLKGIAWIRSLILLLTLTPITVAGLGVREVGYVTFMQLYGIAILRLLLCFLRFRLW